MADSGLHGGGELQAELSEDAKRAAIADEYAGYKAKSFPDVPEVDPLELRALQERGDVVVVDVRAARERAVSGIPGALTQDELEARLARTPDLSTLRVVAYCTIGYRSGVYVRKLRKRGVEAQNLAGSLLAWTLDGLPLADPEGVPTQRVHVYGERWNLVADGYEPVW